MTAIRKCPNPAAPKEEVDVMVVALPVIAAVLTSVPIIAIALVSVASRLEDRDWTIASRQPSAGRTLARRIVGFHAYGIEWLLHAGRGQDEQNPADAARPHQRKTAA
jgi:hypothetical protein